MSDLTEAFAEYLSDVSADLERRLRPAQGKPGRSAKAVALPSAAQGWFDECEQSPGWQNLLDACGYEWPENEDWDETEPMDGRRLKHWMRRSGIYGRLLHGVSQLATLAEEASEQLCADAEESEEELLFLAGLDGVSFEREMHFREFDIAKFDIVKPTAAELTAILGIETNRLFYPHAITSVDTLAGRWYLRTKDRREKRKPARRINLAEPSYIAAFQTSFPKPVENAMKLMALWDWDRFYDGPYQEFEREGVNLGVRVPFVIALSDDPFMPPPFPPTEEPSPKAKWTYNADETAAFERFVSAGLNQLDKTRQITRRGANWGFIDRALNFLLKAFMSRDIDQLVWHTTAIEAVLGEKEEVVKKLTQRVRALYPGDETRKKLAAEVFKRVYDLRSKRVHGSDELTHADETDLRSARTLARTISEQMLRLVGSLAELVDDRKLPAAPRRADILKALDQVEAFDSVVALAMRDLLARPGAAEAKPA
jgi:hypothetical protein